MKISVIIPAYNAQASIRNCIYSISGQNYSDIEIIVVDDGSTDETFSICNEIAKGDDRIHAFQRKNEGSGPARNFGLSVASGDLICFVDADDCWEINVAQTIADIEKNNEFDLIIFGYKQFYKQKLKSIVTYCECSVSGEEIKNRLSEYYMPGRKTYVRGVPWNKVYRRSIIKDNNIQFPALRRHQDAIFVLKYLGYVRNAFFSEQVIYAYQAPSTLQTIKKLPNDYIDIIERKYILSKEIVECWGDNPGNRIALDEIYSIDIIRAAEGIVMRARIRDFLRAYSAYLHVLNDNNRINYLKNSNATGFGIYDLLIKIYKRKNNYVPYLFFWAKRIMEVFRR